MKTILVVITVLILSSGCTDATRSNISTIGNKGSIKCYSGGTLFYEGESTGKILTESGYVMGVRNESIIL